MSNETLAAVRAVAAELRLHGPVKPGLRKRLNEVRAALVEWFNSQVVQREPSAGYRQKYGRKTVRERVSFVKQDGTKHTYINTYRPLVTTKEPLPGMLIRSALFEGIETLVELVASCCFLETPKASWNKQDCASAILTQCDFLEGLLKTEIDGDIDDVVARKFWKGFCSNGSQNARADVIAASVTDEEYAAFGKSKKVKREFFYRLIQDCDTTKTPKWLESRK